jgi:hypothetical protein
MRAIKPVTRRIKRHFGATARRVAVRSQRPWYWQWLVIAGLLLLGYFVAYWQLTGGKNGMNLRDQVEQLAKENAAYEAKVIYSERQLQVEQATQINLNKVLTSVQDENMKLKEEIAFYKNMLKEKAK